MKNIDCELTSNVTLLPLVVLAGAGTQGARGDLRLDRVGDLLPALLLRDLC